MPACRDIINIDTLEASQYANPAVVIVSCVTASKIVRLARRDISLCRLVMAVSARVVRPTNVRPVMPREIASLVHPIAISIKTKNFRSLNVLHVAVRIVYSAKVENSAQAAVLATTLTLLQRISANVAQLLAVQPVPLLLTVLTAYRDIL